MENVQQNFAVNNQKSLSKYPV